MKEAIVLARAYGGEPIRRVVMGAGKRSIYLANPDYLDEVRSGDSHPIGFPEYDVFCFNTKVYEDLRDQWHRTGTTNPKVWDTLLPYRANIA